MDSLLEQVIRSSVDGILAFDREFRYTLWNPGMERISGVAASECLGRVAFDVFPFLVETGEDEYFRRALAGEPAVAADRYFTVPSTGRGGYFEGHYSPIRSGNGAVVGGLAVIRDISERKRAERERARLLEEHVERRGEERYAVFVAQSTEGIWRVELERPVEVTAPADEQIDDFYAHAFMAECNDAMARMYGFERAGEIVGARLADFLPRSDPHNVAYLRAFVESGYRLEGAESHEHDRSGAPKHFRNNLVGVVEGGHLVRAWGIQQDITDRVLAERAIERSEARLQLAQRAARVGTFEIDAASGAAVWSEGIWELLGLPEGSVEPGIGTFMPLVHPDDRDRVLAEARRALESGDAFSDEFRIVRPDGRELWLAARGRVERDDGDVRMIGVNLDITEQKRAEAERERALALHRAVEEGLSRLVEASGQLLNLRRLDEVQEAVVDLARRLVTADGYAIWRRLEVNGEQVWRVVASWGVSDAYLDGSMRLLDPSAPIIDRPIVAEDVLGHPSFAGRRELYRAEGIRSMIAAPMRIRGGVGGTAVFYYRSPRHFADADARVAEAIANLASAAIEGVELFEEQARLRAEAEEANRLKDEFLATVSHELRTPLNAIVGWANLLVGGRLDEEVSRRALAAIDRNARAQAQIVEDLLDVSRVVTGRLRLDVAPLALADVIEAAVDALRPAAAAKGVAVRARLDPATGHVSGDPDRLQQVAWNLLSNAVKFTSEGGRVDVILEPSDSGVHLVVRDTGAGISADFLPYVFDPFRQADSSTTRRVGGLGLGLAIVRRLVELHGGSVRAESAGVGEGATFTVELPAALGAEAAPERPAPAPPAAREPSREPDARDVPSLGGVRVLVIDDEPDARALLATTLAQAGATVETAASAEEALLAIGRVRPHVLISDIAMPAADGYEFIRKVRAAGPEGGAKTPAIALTAYARGEDRIRALAAGFQAHVTKPVEPRELVYLVASLVGIGAGA